MYRELQDLQVLVKIYNLRRWQNVSNFFNRKKIYILSILTKPLPEKGQLENGVETKSP